MRVLFRDLIPLFGRRSKPWTFPARKLPDVDWNLMGILRHIAVLGAPILLSAAVARIYWYFNIVKQLFVNRYGCGCRSGFNTNTITSILFYCIVGVVCIASWRLSLRLSFQWRIAYFGVIVAYLLVFGRLFLLHNLWF